MPVGKLTNLGFKEFGIIFRPRKDKIAILLWARNDPFKKKVAESKMFTSEVVYKNCK